MGRIDESDVLQVQRASDIVQVIQGYLGQLKRSGSNYKALCPFHEEKTPSFSINPAGQFYYCFGCHKGGDVFRFVMEHERLDFPDAVRLLADRAGLRIREREGGDGTSGLRPKILDVNVWAASLFEDLLRESPEGAAAREYVRKRGISPEMVKAFRIGWSHASWDRLLTRGRAKGYPAELLEQAGLVIRRHEGPGWYDRFRNRLMFPIVDPRNQVVGFGARSLDGAEPKYLNSPETPVFTKGRGFYGLNFAKELPPGPKRTLYVVEGYTDVIMARQHGVAGVVATLGTALTREHLGLLRRYADVIALVYDGDEAGVKASERSTDLLVGEECEVRVARLPSGEDPCDTLLKRGADAFRECLAQSRELFEFVIEPAGAGAAAGGAAALARAADAVIARLAAVTNPVRREMLAKRTAEAFGVSEGSVLQRAAAFGTAGARPGAPARRPAPAPAAATPEDRLGEELLSVVFAAPQLVPRLREQVPLEAFPGAAAGAIARALYAVAGAAEPVEMRAVLATLQDPALVSRATAIAAAGDKGGRFEERLAAAVGQLAERRRKGEGRAIQQKIREASARGDRDAVDRLLAEYNRLARAANS